MLGDLNRALARVQDDYGFYIECLENPTAALAGYDLSPDERSLVTDPEKLADALKPGVGRLNPRAWSITIKISGTHDWVNRAAPNGKAMTDVDRDANVAIEVHAIKKATTDEKRTEAVVRLMELIG
jgi:hypothetical protein